MAAYRVGFPLLFRHQQLVATSCVVIPRRHHDPRDDRPWFQKLQREKQKEAKKTLTRKIDEMFDLEPAIPNPPKENNFVHPLRPKQLAFDETHEHYKDKAVYMCVNTTNFHEGVAQAMWLTKTKPMGEGKLPEQIQHLAETVEIPNMEDKVHESILQTRLYDTEDTCLNTKRFGIRQVESLLRISAVLGPTYPELLQRAMARYAYVVSMFNRGDDLISTRGDPHGFLLTSKKPLAPLAGPEEINATKEYEMPSFYPVAPTIDLVSTNIYKDQDFTGFHAGYPYPHAHTLFYLNTKYQRDHKFLVSRAIMFAHAHAVARAKVHYGIKEEVDLQDPIVVQCIVSEGVRFSFLHYQLNTLRHASDDGIKNMVWLDHDNVLFNDMYPQDIKIRRRKKNRKTKRSYIKKMKTRRDPLQGCQDVNVEVYRKFLACYVNGAVSL